jgi:hypothetical protein
MKIISKRRRGSLSIIELLVLMLDNNGVADELETIKKMVG